MSDPRRVPSPSPLRTRLAFLAAALATLAAAGCSGEQDPAADPGAASARAGGAPSRERGDAGSRPSPGAGEADEARPVDPATVGRVTGVVRFEGEPPERRPIGMGAEPACRHDGPVLTETVVVDGGRLRDVFVFVKRGHEGWIPPPPPDEPVVLDQRGCLYVPHVVALQTGQTLLVRNSDQTTHNVNVKARRNGVNGNYTQSRNQADLALVFERREHSIPFKCDIHPWMGAWCYVQDHPWFAVSAADGTFAIEGLPPGDYTLEAIHEKLGERRVDVHVEPGGSASVELAFGG